MSEGVIDVLLPMPTLAELRLPFCDASRDPPCNGEYVTSLTQLHTVTVRVDPRVTPTSLIGVVARNEEGRATKLDVHEGWEAAFIPSPRPEHYSVIMVRRNISPPIQPWSSLVQYALVAAPMSWRGAFHRSLGGLRIVDKCLSGLRERDIVPRREFIFRALELCPLETVRVVIIGQDPYPDDKSTGLAFSVPRSAGIPDDVKNIYAELHSDYPQDWHMPRHADLTKWSTHKGILLLNSSLTTRAGVAGAHDTGIWDSFVTNVIIEVVKHQRNVVFVLLGRSAQAYRELIPSGRHRAIDASHPAPRSYARGRNPFKGSGIFRAINDYFTDTKRGLPPIDWNV